MRLIQLWLAALSVFASNNAMAQQTPRAEWRLKDAIGAPSWLGFGLEHRARFEHIQNDFRSSADGSSSALLLRTLLSAELKLDPVVVGVELQDSRAYATNGTPLNTAIVNPLEIVQAYVGLRHQGLFLEGDSAYLMAGRFTMDVGSRRLVTRNQFRNTLNTFTGIDLQYSGPEKQTVRGFAVVPVRRLPTDPTMLSDNRIELDRESIDSIFWGLFLAATPIAGLQFETYVFGLHERDGEGAPSTNRRIYTPGARVLRPQAPGQLDYELEVMLQLGTSRATLQDTIDLNHRAVSAHAAVGYRFDVVTNPRLALEYDYASGDGDPKDGTNGRFDPLFDDRRVDFGPVGLYGAFNRGNINSPGVRLEFTPHQTVDAFAHYQPFWLASKRDAWTAAGLRDPMGDSGRFVGHQIEGRLRWHIFPKNLIFEVVGAYLVRGEFATDAPNAKSDDPVFVYTSITGAI